MTVKHVFAGAVLVGFAAVLFVPEIRADDTEELSLTDYVLYGVSGSTNELLRYQFDDEELTTKGTVQLSSGDTLAGIEAMAYVPGRLNIYAFWLDPSDGNSRLVYINSGTAEASLVGEPIGQGQVTAATVVKMALNEDGDLVLPGSDDAVAEEPADPLGPDEPTPVSNSRRTAVIAIQSLVDGEADGEDQTVAMSGLVNINPNNSPHSEFSLTTGDGQVITRDDLHQGSPVDGDGIFYTGEATRVFFKPKGNGNQNTLLVDGEVYPLHNSSTYEITSESMTVTVYNDHIHKNGKAMGHWWLGIVTAAANFSADGEAVAGDPTPVIVARLVRVDANEGQAEQLMTLTHEYDGLAATAAGLLYGTSGQEIYGLDPIAETETLVGTMTSSQIMGLEFAGETLCGFSVANERLVPMAVDGTVLGSSIDLGTANLRSIIFMRNPDEPVYAAASFD